MTATKQRKAVCVGYGDGAGRLHKCGSPALPVERTGRCSRCDRLQRAPDLARADPFVSINDVPLPGEALNRALVREALRPVAVPPVVAPMVAAEPEMESELVAVEPLPEPESEPELVESEAAEPEPWHSQWPACLLCGRTAFKHGGNGYCKSCSGGVTTRWKACKGVAVFFVPFVAGDPTRYDHGGAKRWVVARDLAKAWAYLERRAAAGGIPTGGKAVIRPTSKAGELPETVIRRAA